MADDRFRTTHWSLIEAYQHSDCPQARDNYLNELAQIYRAPVNAYLQRKGYPPDAADDLTQEFFTAIVLGRELFDKADPKKARLRALMFASLKNFVIDDYRRRGAHAVQREVLTDPSIIDEQKSVENDSEEGLFFQGFFGAVLKVCFQRCEEHYVSAGKESLWRAYEAFVIRPILSGTAKPSLRDIASDYTFVSVAAAGSAVYSVKERLKILVRVEISNTVANEADAEEEYRLLMSLLG